MVHYPSRAFLYGIARGIGPEYPWNPDPLRRR